MGKILRNALKIASLLMISMLTELHGYRLMKKIKLNASVNTNGSEASKNPNYRLANTRTGLKPLIQHTSKEYEGYKPSKNSVHGDELKKPTSKKFLLINTEETDVQNGRHHMENNQTSVQSLKKENPKDPKRYAPRAISDTNKFVILKQGRCLTRIASKTKCKEIANQLYPNGEYKSIFAVLSERFWVLTIKDDKFPPGCIRTTYDFLGYSGPLFFWNEAKSNALCGKVTFGCLDLIDAGMKPMGLLLHPEGQECRSEADCVCEDSSDPVLDDDWYST